MQHLPAHMLTYNRHTLVCRLAKQELARGCTGKDGELWVQRGMQRCKSNVKYRITAVPEKLLMHDQLVDAALVHAQQQDMLAPHAQPRVMTFDQLVPEYRANIRSGPLYDLGHSTSHTQLLGKGKPLAAPSRIAAGQQLAQFFGRMPQADCPCDPGAAELLQLHAYTMAHKGGDEILWARSSGRSRSRCGLDPCMRALMVGLQLLSARPQVHGGTGGGAHMGGLCSCAASQSSLPASAAQGMRSHAKDCCVACPVRGVTASATAHS